MLEGVDKFFDILFLTLGVYENHYEIKFIDEKQEH